MARAVAVPALLGQDFERYCMELPALVVLVCKGTKVHIAVTVVMNQLCSGLLPAHNLLRRE